MRQKEIDWLRGFAIFNVILGHSIIVFPINLHEVVWCKFLYDTIYSFHMPLFFAISGYCYSLGKGYSKYLKKKAVRLLMPYFFFSFFGILPRLLLPGLVNGETSIAESTKSIFFYGGEYWFLYVLFVISALFPLIEKAVYGNEIITVIGTFVLTALSNFFPLIICIRLVAYYLFFFTLGYVVKRHSIFNWKISKKKIGIVLCGGLLVSLCGYLHGKFSYSWMNSLEAVVGITFFTLTSMLFPKVFSKFEKYSPYTLTLYLMNGYWLVISRTVIVSIFHINNPIIIIISNLIVDFYFSYLIIKHIIAKIPGINMLCGIQIKRQKELI